MSLLDQELRRRLDALDQAGLRRHLRRIDSGQSPLIRIDGKTFLNFSSNDYLGLAGHPSLKAGARAALDTFGAGSGASRLICGSLAPHHQLEETLAAFKGTEAALTFASGYAAALGTIGALIGPGDIVIIDKRAHACLIDAARLCRAKLRVFRHNDLNHLADVLAWADRQSHTRAPAALGSPTPLQPSRGQILIITESLFSMDGDRAPLIELVELKEKHGAWLMVDEAHATGLFGLHGRGLADESGLRSRIEIQMGTLGKAVGAAGGYICGSRTLIDYLVNRARTFVFSTAPVPALAGAARTGLELVRSAEGDAKRQVLWERIRDLREILKKVASNLQPGCQIQPAAASPEADLAAARKSLSAIQAWILGPETKALEMAGRLRAAGIFVPAIRYPTVARGAARLRFTVTAAHTPDQLAALAAAAESLVS